MTQDTAQQRDVIVIGASAGGVEALKVLTAGLDPALPAAVLITMHVPAIGTSVLPAILSRSGSLPAEHARHGDALESGRIYVAPPDRHLAIVDHSAVLSAGPRENGHRPAVDVLFRTAARALGRRVVAVVLSGGLDDGSAGLVAVQRRGGVAVVQEPRDALHPAMPTHAIAAARPEHVVPVGEMADLLAKLVEEPLDPGRSEVTPDDDIPWEADVALLVPDALSTSDRPGVPAGLSCPDCSGPLFEVGDSALARFRCRVGHAWSLHSLSAGQDVAVDAALWTALRSVEERAALAESMASRLRADDRAAAARALDRRVAEARSSARVLIRLLDSLSPAASAERETAAGDI
jgi:two-component system, chemotaxis family, protein-glutamate methylesterase/glutaminase